MQIEATANQDQQVPTPEQHSAKAPAFYITTPIYYVNDMPHIGHAYTSVACDMVARFKRLDGFDVLFVSGTDEHGLKIEQAAGLKSQNPQAFVDEVSLHFRNLLAHLNISNDLFMRTTSAQHKTTVQHIWQQLAASGFIYLGNYEGWYATRDECYYQQAELVNGKAPSGATVEWLTEPCYFFKLSAFSDQLLKFYEQHPEAIQPHSRLNEVTSFIKGGLKDLAVSRASIKWGIATPNNDHVIYVWLDALTNYLSAINYPQASYKKYWDQVVHVIGKDILRFHAIYWPAFLLALGLSPPKLVFAHGWWTIEGEKMSKSLGNVIIPQQITSLVGVDGLRYFLLREVAFGQDGDFNQTNLINRYNADLANSYGNLCQRVLSFIFKNLNGLIKCPAELLEIDQNLINLLPQQLPLLRNNIDHLHLNKYLETIWHVVYAANKYVDEQKPWQLIKDNQLRLSQVLYTLTAVIRQLCILCQPVMPDSSLKLASYLNIDLNNSLDDLGELPKEFNISEPQPLFMKFKA